MKYAISSVMGTETMFDSQNLLVDWISFRFPKSFQSETAKGDLTNFLVQIGFTIYQESKAGKYPIQKSLETAFFAIYSNQRNSIILSFSGSNGHYFYTLVQKQLIRWEFWTSGKLTRFDLCFCRTLDSNQQLGIRKFFLDCQTYLEKKNQTFSFQTNSQGFLLTIGSRRSNQYSRIYQAKNLLRFEHEMKGKFISNYHSLLVSNSFKEFEQQLTRHYLKHLGTILPLEQSYLDWLVSRLRPLRQAWISPVVLKLDYLDEKEIRFTTFETKRNFIKFLQFLRFTNSLEYELRSLDSPYRKVVFRVQDFLKYQNPYVDSTNYYQLKKLRLFLEDLQSNSLIKSFSSSKFRSLVTIPDVKLIKSETNVWIANVWIAEELFQYSYPFLVPDFFESEQLSKQQFAILFELISGFTSTVNLEKHFQLDQFFDNYSKLSNQRKLTMKKTLIFFIQKFQQKGLIDDSIQIIPSKQSLRSITVPSSQLKVSHLRNGFILSEKLLID